jgi:succinoglycan biosynthesis transport protein ExoP
MELKNFYFLLKRHRFSLIIIPIIAAVVTYFWVHTNPNDYVSSTQIASGIVDQTQRVIGSQEGYVQETKITEEFTNLIEIVQLNKVVEQVSYLLLIHDLKDTNQFKNVSQKILLSPEVKNKVINRLNEKLNSFEVLNLENPEDLLINSLLIKMGYDHEALLKNIVVYRPDNSDFINLDVNSENPLLSAFIANNLANRFITYYTNYVNSGRNKTNDFLYSLLQDKKNAMNQKIAALEAFKVKNGILDIGDESKDVYGQISDLETHQQQAEKDVIAYSGALKSIDNKFDPKDRKYLEATTSKINGVILNTRERLRVLNDKYLQSDFNPRYKKSIDSLQDVLSSQINESSDKYISNPLAAKDNIVQEKLKMENELELARYSANSLKSQLTSLKGRLNALVPSQAALKSYEREIDIATKEYLDVQDKYNQANVSTNLPVQLRQIQAAMPGVMKPSKKALLIGLSGITSLIFYLAILLLIFYLDDNVRSSEDLERLTKIRVLGELNMLSNKSLDLKKKQNELKSINDIHVYRNLIRSVRFEIDQELKDSKVLAITSLNQMEGKTLFSFSLAYTYALMNKKVLLIDGNFNNPLISNTVKSNDFLEDYFKDGILTPQNQMLPDSVEKRHLLDEVSNKEIDNDTRIGKAIRMLSDQSNTEVDKKNSSISILGNKGDDNSLLEICSEKDIQDRMDVLKSKFDIIIIETGALNTLNKSKEWILFADKSIAIFESNQSIKDYNKSSIKYLKGLNGKMLGWVLNKVVPNSSEMIKS